MEFTEYRIPITGFWFIMEHGLFLPSQIACLIIDSILTWVMKKRIHQIELFMKYPHEVQDEVLKKLLSTARFTEFGQHYAFEDLVNYEDFRKRIPVHTYEQTFPYIERLMRGENKMFCGLLK